jgi:hypothetical protein
MRELIVWRGHYQQGSQVAASKGNKQSPEGRGEAHLKFFIFNETAESAM